MLKIFNSGSYISLAQKCDLSLFYSKKDVQAGQNRCFPAIMESLTSLFATLSFSGAI